MPEMRTLGVEEELHIVDAGTFELASGAPQILGRLPPGQFTAELQRSTVETNTSVCTTLQGLREQVVHLRVAVAAAARHHGMGIVASGTAPLAGPGDFELTARGRYSRMQQDYRLLVDEHLVCGLQVHVGVDDRDQAVRLLQRVDTALPTLLALSASSPFWDSQDTGYASVRTTIWQRWPTAGRAPQVGSAAEYDRLLDGLIASGVISDANMAYFDVRPSAHVPTLELRICDSTPLVDDVILIAGLWRAVVEQAAEADRAGEPLLPRPAALYRAAMWRAARSGLAGPLLDDGAAPVPRPAEDVVRSLIERLRPQLEETGDHDQIAELSSAALARGCSSDRQRARFAESGRIVDVVRSLVAETEGRTVVEQTRSSGLMSGYPVGRADEAVSGDGSPFSAYRPVFEILDRLGADEMAGRADLAHRHSLDTELTFGVDGEQQVFPVDLFPRVIPAHEWSTLAAGLTQRARAIEAFLRDAYGPARIVADGVMPSEILFGGPAWANDARLLPEGVPRAPVIGFDLVRDEVGGWRVLEDNVRVPSGVGYAIAVRRILQGVVPELDPGPSIHSPEDALALIAHTLRACSPRAEAVVALLSDGADSSGWFEHRLLAAEAGLVLAQPSEIEIDSRGVTVGGRGIDVVYLRLGCELAELTDAGGRAVGAQLFDAAIAGTVVLANAPGNGIADDKSMYCHVPDLIAYYLHERPQLAPVPTYRCADPTERVAVLDRLDKLVTKPVGGHGGGGVLIGAEASSAELDRRRQEIVEDPQGWVAQETVWLSTLPTLVNGHLEPRHVDLRAFVYVTGTGAGEATLADLALTRTAPAGSMVVNSSRGGGAKDTWIQVGPDAGGPEMRSGAGGREMQSGGDQGVRPGR